MEKFNNASQVRAFLKDKFPERVKIRWMNNPFGGEGHFNVTLAVIPHGVSVVSSSSSVEKDYTFGSSDNGITAGKLRQLRNPLKETNAACTG